MNFLKLMIIAAACSTQLHEYAIASIGSGKPPVLAARQQSQNSFAKQPSQTKLTATIENLLLEQPTNSTMSRQQRLEKLRDDISNHINNPTDNRSIKSNGYIQARNKEIDQINKMLKEEFPTQDQANGLNLIIGPMNPQISAAIPQQNELSFGDDKPAEKTKPKPTQLERDNATIDRALSAQKTQLTDQQKLQRVKTKLLEDYFNNKLRPDEIKAIDRKLKIINERLNEKQTSLSLNLTPENLNTPSIEQFVKTQSPDAQSRSLRPREKAQSLHYNTGGTRPKTSEALELDLKKEIQRRNNSKLTQQDRTVLSQASEITTDNQGLKTYKTSDGKSVTIDANINLIRDESATNSNDLDFSSADITDKTLSNVGFDKPAATPQTKTKLQTLSDTISQLKAKSSSEYRLYFGALKNNNQLNQKYYLGQYITTTLEILSLRGSYAKEAVTSTISSLFTSLKVKISPKTKKEVIQQAVESAPTAQSSQSYVSQWISSISRAISDAVFGKGENNSDNEDQHRL